MAGDLLQRLEGGLKEFTTAERAIANFILTNPVATGYESATSIATKLRVSAVTVGRFARALGYRNFKALKADLQTSMTGAPWLVGEQLARFVENSGDSARRKRSLEIELAGLVEVYSLAETAGWRQVVDLLARSSSVFVAGFQTERGVAASLAYLLQYVRPAVHLIDVAAGNYHEVFAEQPSAGGCLVLFDMRRYSEQSYRLAEAASDQGIPLVFVTDPYCDWARKFTPHVLSLPTEVGLFWSSHVSTSCAVNLLVNDVIVELGASVEMRFAKLSDLYQAYTGHVGSIRGRRGIGPRST